MVLVKEKLKLKKGMIRFGFVIKEATSLRVTNKEIKFLYLFRV